METRLAAPDQPVSGGFLRLMIQLTIASGRQGLQQPVSADELQWREYWGRHQKLYNQLQAKYAALLAQSIHLKTGGARAVSANTLLELKWDKSKLPDVASFFNDLSPQEQRSLLEYRWKRIAGDSMLPILRQLYRKRPEGNSEDSYEISEIHTFSGRSEGFTQVRSWRNWRLSFWTTPIPKSLLMRPQCWGKTVLTARKKLCGEGLKNGVVSGTGGSRS